MRISFIFPGQGSQYIGMGQEMHDNFRVARDTFEEADEILGFNLSRMCFDGPDDILKLTFNAQPAILTVSVACMRVLKERGLHPFAVAGHSLGEYSALVAAESIAFTEAVQLVHKRGKLMQDCAPSQSGMVAVLGLEKELVIKACLGASSTGVVEVANFNSPGQIVIAGEVAALNAASESCKNLGAKRVIPLQVSGPFHSSLMVEAGSRLAVELANTSINNPVCPLISNVSAGLSGDSEDIKALLAKQVSSSVRWEESVQKLWELGTEAFIEVGPGKVLTGLGKKIIKEATFYNIEDLSSLEKTLDNLKEVI